jgi:hypothetical protein
MMELHAWKEEEPPGHTRGAFQAHEMKGRAMIERTVTLPQLGLIAGTRAALGAGVALLLGDRLNSEQRRAVGWTLTLVGVISTFPLVAGVFGSPSPSRSAAPRTRSTARHDALAR